MGTNCETEHSKNQLLACSFLHRLTRISFLSNCDYLRSNRSRYGFPLTYSNPSSAETYNLIWRNFSSFFASNSSGLNAPVSTFLRSEAFSLIFTPSCSWVNPFFIRASRIILPKSCDSTVSSVSWILLLVCPRFLTTSWFWPRGWRDVDCIEELNDGLPVLVIPGS
jgi:hypothetical protein